MRFLQDQRDLKALKRFYKRSPRQFRRATAGFLNGLAFKLREGNLKALRSDLTIRNDGFIRSSVRVNKARASDPINSQVSEVGSIKRDRFTGWAEQEGQKPDKRTRLPTLEARRGDEKRQVVRGARLRSGVEIRKSPGARVGRWLSELSESDSKKMFMLRKRFRKNRPGVYRFKGPRRKVTVRGKIYMRRRIEQIHRFRSGSKNVPRVNWMSKPRSKIVGDVQLHRKLLAESIEFVLSPPKRIRKRR